MGSQVYLNPHPERGTSCRKSHSFTLSKTERESTALPLAANVSWGAGASASTGRTVTQLPNYVAFCLPPLLSTSSAYSFLEEALGLGTSRNKNPPFPLSLEIPTPASAAKPVLRSSRVWGTPEPQGRATLLGKSILGDGLGRFVASSVHQVA